MPPRSACRSAAAFLSADWATKVNGWLYPPPEYGRLGDDFLWRASLQSLSAIVANDPLEAVYLANFSDSSGADLSANDRYELHFDADELPPVDAFWSLSAYTEPDMNLVPNPADRFSVGSKHCRSELRRRRRTDHLRAAGLAGR